MCSLRVQVFSNLPTSVVPLGCGAEGGVCESMGYYVGVFAITVSSHCLSAHGSLACPDTRSSPKKALTRGQQHAVESTRHKLTRFINFQTKGPRKSQVWWLTSVYKSQHLES